jgi:membrane-associated protein
MLESLAEALSSSPWTYAVVLGFAAFDALLPFFPSETAAIAAGVLAAAGDLNIFLVVASAAGGALLGDSSSYLVGRTAGHAAVSRLFGAGAGTGLGRLAWAERVLRRRGWYLIVVARSVPGGRTAVTLTAGLTRMRGRSFVPAAAVAALLWASFAGGLGYLGGSAFEDDPWRGLVAAAGFAALLVLGIEGARWLRRPRRRLCMTCTG